MTNPQADAALVASILWQVGEVEFAAGFQGISYTDDNPTLALQADMLTASLRMAGIVYSYSAAPTDTDWSAMRLAVQFGAPAIVLLVNPAGGGEHRLGWLHAHKDGRIRVYRWVDQNRALACQPAPDRTEVLGMILLADLVTLDMDEVPVLTGD